MRNLHIHRYSPERHAGTIMQLQVSRFTKQVIGPIHITTWVRNCTICDKPKFKRVVTPY